jgi:hypothetical protein
MKKIIKENGTIIAILIGWLFVQFICLMSSKNSVYSDKSIFYPFTSKSLNYSYDITEFLVYGVTPIVIFVIIKLINNEKN